MSRTTVAASILALTGLALPAAGQAAPPSLAVPRSSTLIDSLGSAFMAAGRSPGLVIVVMRGADTLLVKGWGRADLELDVPASPQHVFQLASITKQFVSTAVLQLVADGRVELDGPIGRYLPELPEAWREVTVRQFLNHTSGVPNFAGPGEALERHWAESITPQEIIAFVAPRPLRFAPGTRWEYNGTGYVVLGMLIERVTGLSWGDDLARRFTAKLHLPTISTCPLASLMPGRVRGYERSDKSWKNMRPMEPAQRYTAGGLCGSAFDVIRWSAALHAGQLLPDSLYRAMITPRGAAQESHYGFGIYADTIAGQPVLYHAGTNHGFSSFAGWSPSAKVNVVILANAGFASLSELGRQIVRASLGVPLALSR